jgi:hypothetical protein
MRNFVEALFASRRSPELDDAGDLFDFRIGHCGPDGQP